MTEEQLDDTASMVLIFRLEGESFAITVDAVHEILDPQDPTPVPNADPFAPGLINVRGVVVPVIDVRRRLGMGPPHQTEAARMIVVEHAIEDIQTKIAFLAEAVEKVVEADLEQLERVPELGTLWPQVYLRGALRREGDLVVVLDPDTLFTPVVQHQAA